MTTLTDRIEKTAVLKAPRARVWQALTDPRQFSEWFGVRITEPFTPGARVRGPVTHPGYEHLTFDIQVEEVEPERRLSWRWHPQTTDPVGDHASEPSTLVVFELADAPGGTALHVIESGFDGLPAEHRLEAFRRNEGGWAQQMVAIERHVATH